MARVLIIDDDQLMCQSLSLVTERKGHETVCAYTLSAGMEKASAGEFDVVFLDVRMPDGNGLDIVPILRKLTLPPEIIIITGYGDPNGAELAIKNGVWDYLEKGASVKDINLSLIRALQYRKQKQTGNCTCSFVVLKREGIIGSSPSLEACLDQVAQAASSDCSVLITGETGTGKELFARAVHQNSRRCNKNFVVVDCASLPETLIESILFGHEKGVFTGADHAHDGLILQADGGTLFLDEVGEMPLTLQKAFLRVLQDHTFRPLGSNRELNSDFRLVVATNRNLEEMVQAGQFRSDLLFRLRSFSIELPSLRLRTDDISLLARYHTDKICDHYDIPYKNFSTDFLKSLSLYSWPGNVREFTHTMERTIVCARFESTIFPKHLPMQIRIEITKFGMKGELPLQNYDKSPVFKDLPMLHVYRDSIYSQAERQYLQDLMDLTKKDIGEACRVSGLSQSRLYALLKKQGISLQQ